jgi:transcriptional regulator with XRE-family HTH domain
MGERVHTARARVLGDELREFREWKGLSGQELADRLGWSASKLSRIENGLTGFDEIDLVRYAAHCGFSSDDIDDLLERFREPAAPGYWLTDRCFALVFHENTAAFSASYDPLVVPGLLQTEDYATALIGPEKPWLVHVRMERQRLLNQRGFEFFIHEQALRLPVGGNRVMNEQLLKLVLLTDHPKITIRVLPTSLGADAALGGSFVIFRFDGHEPLVYVEHQFVGLFLEEHKYVSQYRDKLATLSGVALSRGQSRELLAALASEFDHPEDSPDVPDPLAQEQLQRGT